MALEFVRCREACWPNGEELLEFVRCRWPDGEVHLDIVRCREACWPNGEELLEFVSLLGVVCLMVRCS